MKTKLSFSMLLLQSGRPLSCESSSKRYYFCLWWNIRKMKPLLLWDSVFVSISILFRKTAIAWKTSSTKYLMCYYMGKAHEFWSFLPSAIQQKKQELQICRLFLLRVKLQNVPKSWKYLLNVLKTLTLFN